MRAAVHLLAIALLAAPDTSRPAGLPDLDEYAPDIRPSLSAGLMAAFAWHGPAVGTDLRFAWPLLPSGFISDARFRDGLVLELGLDFCRWSWDSAGQSAHLMLFAPLAGLGYLVYFWDTVAPFLTVRLGPAFAVADNTSDQTRFYWQGGAGVIWDLTDFLSLRFEFGWGSTRDLLRLGAIWWW